MERGDRRGLVVRVRGQLCVLDVMKVYDTQAVNAAWQADESDDVRADEEIEQEEEEIAV
ncbi:hypothetical protein WGE86_21440 [Xanthomonas euvesicatoria pv. euvesicatoria]|uniref:hypothetical protein n=1 Tax=Xanthomonas euvesicatoria TaxID=456327 RepID=UPI000ADAE3C7|nr:hypothetical protein [Xanthomonas euvesicatoria]MCC8514703.1 hypothetical protein [Xanthomonas euvesicatoria pv. euvesicatoria]MCC8547765.1 hypothetical protein [Xanthomonas euvesicatoria pv. euvesicatoria]MCC8612546.1 hypothetical protein [Xanthomonas euvesicatoria pv. euvesicatoria]